MRDITATRAAGLSGSAVRHGLLLGVSALALGISAPALAQDAADPAAQTAEDEDDEKDDGILVTGVRASIASAQSIKQNSDQFVDSITAIDIGKLPDVNVAEALQRVSGIQITRNRGEGSSIAIRGLTQVRTETNGRDSFSANAGRGLSFEDVPSELLAGVDVYKNPSAELIEGGVGGTINLRTRMPFDQKRDLYSLTLGANHYDLIDETKLNISALVSKRWETGIGDIGILVDLSHFEGAFRQDSITVEPFWDRTDIPGFVGQTRSVAAGGGTGVNYGERERRGYYGAIQWAPSNSLELYATYFRSEYYLRNVSLTYFGFGPSGSGGGLTPVAGSFAFDTDGTLQRGSFLNIPINNNTAGYSNRNDTTDIAGGFKFAVTDRLRINGDVQRIRAHALADNLILTGGALNGGTFAVDLTGDVPAIGQTPPSLITSPANYYYAAVQDHHDDNDGDEFAARLDLEWDFDDGFLRTLTAGARYTDRGALNRGTNWGTSWSGVSATWDGSGTGVAAPEWASPPSVGGGAVTFTEAPATYFVTDPFASTFLRGDTSAIVGAPFINPSFLNDMAGTLALFSSDTFAPTPTFGPRGLTPYTPSDINTQHENTYAAYGMLRFGTSSGFRFDGNIGVRAVKTKTRSDGFQVVSYRTNPADPTGGTTSITAPLSVEQDYTYVLPSLNLRAHLTDNLQARFAASRGLSRPNFDAIRAQFNVGESYLASPTPPPVGTPDPGIFQRFSGSGGNPYLKPLKVTQFDAALEWYPKSSTMLYGTLFYKKVYDFIQNGVFDTTFDSPNRGPVPYRITAQVNGEEGTIKGFEIGGNTFFDFLPGPLSGLGIQANLTYVDSQAPSPTATSTSGAALIVPLEGLSKWSYNVIGIYEKYGVTLRVAYNWRDSYVVTTAGTGTGNLPILAHPFGQLDASLSYDINEHVAFSIQAVNLTDSPWRSYQYTPNRPRDYQLNDRRIGGSLRFRF